MKDLTKKNISETLNYINFKIAQYMRLTNFDPKQPNAKDKLKEIVLVNAKKWILES